MKIGDNICRDIRLAGKILNKKTPYSRNKELIYSMVKNDKKFDKNTIYKHLTVIDSMYSTNMNKRYFGIDEITDKIVGFGSRGKLRKEIKKFLANPTKNSHIGNLFNEEYGQSKEGKKMRAPSIISKYLYFVNDYDFPIYDSLVIKHQKNIVKCYNLGEKEVHKIKSDTDIYDFLKEMKKTKEAVDFICRKSMNRICSFDDLDKLLWLVGKLRKSSFSLIITRQQFKALLKLAKGKNIDEYMKKAVSSDNCEDISEIIHEDLLNFYRFTLDL